MKIRDATEIFASLAQETRLAIFRLLIRAAPRRMPAGEIAQALEVPAPTLSFHLSHLSNAGLIHSERHGRSILYAIDLDGVQKLIGYLVDDCCQGRPDLCGKELAANCMPRKGPKCTTRS